MGTLKSYTIVFVLGYYVSLIDGQARPQNYMFAHPPAVAPFVLFFAFFAWGQLWITRKKNKNLIRPA